MGNLNDRIRELENKIKDLESKIDSLAKAKRIQPESKVPLIIDKFQINMPSTGTGLGKIPGMKGNIIFNDAELKSVPWGTQPSDALKGYNKHSHGRYSGGALDINTLELVEYETDEDGDIVDTEGNKLNKNCQSYWKNQPAISKASDGITEKIGVLDIEFDPSSRKWITGSNMVDVERTYLVQYAWYDEEGNEVEEGTEGAIRQIKRDENGNDMKAPLLYTASEDENENLNKSNVIWDKDAKCWRFYAVFKPAIEES